MSGTLAALSDTLFPATSVRAALAQDFSGGSSWLQHLRFLHPVTAVIAGLFICWLLLRSVPRPGTQIGHRSTVAPGPAVWPRDRGRGAAGSAVDADYSSSGSGHSMDHPGCVGCQDLRGPPDTGRRLKSFHEHAGIDLKAFRFTAAGAKVHKSLRFTLGVVRDFWCEFAKQEFTRQIIYRMSSHVEEAVADCQACSAITRGMIQV